MNSCEWLSVCKGGEAVTEWRWLSLLKPPEWSNEGGSRNPGTHDGSLLT